MNEPRPGFLGGGAAGRVKRRMVRLLQRFVVNPIVRPVAGYVPGTALLETTGRRSGEPRHNPVGGRLEGSSFWAVAEYGRKAHYVRNIEANPRVRLRVRGRWREGTAHLLPEDDPYRRLRRMAGLNSLLVWLVGTDLLTIQIDLDDY